MQAVNSLIPVVMPARCPNGTPVCSLVCFMFYYLYLTDTNYIIINPINIAMGAFY